jgi:peptide/nickel transport system permease protein
VAILRLILSRLLLSLLTLTLVSMIIFSAIEIIPGDVASRVLGRMATTESLAIFRERFHLNDPPIVRYLSWVGSLVKGDLGLSMTNNRPVIDILAPRIANTLILSLVAFLLHLPLAVIPAALQAFNRDRLVDQGLSVMNLVLLSIPEFLLATLFMIAFVIVIPAFPAMSLVDRTSTFGEYARALALPAVTLAIAMAVYTVRLLRDNLIEVLDSDFVRMAELKGLPRRLVVWRHALPNALIPSLNITALNLAYAVGGVVVIEKVFAFPGFGSLLVDSVSARDIPLIEATVLLSSAVYIFGNLAADVLAIVFNPKLRAD